jgi:hypothetical protein
MSGPGPVVGGDGDTVVGDVDLLEISGHVHEPPDQRRCDGVVVVILGFDASL